ncbi:c-type cytochrome [Oharaeibacter diazotrophicus]|uniref:Mono/diheme cytochrome c family protein n=1 Tax=Oharaeibacter diazotrophicus TaxID=1920512 RepID=A0A4R6RN84_9HYPH|nr:cytochrome c [Oharaeibacter diazotrophicus]TDP87517.1 mono/diheme cytochrome c family protein [Oharaeibacter diazotrophicus]BBE70539.1 nicotinate dehydrogenase subunit B [Pleomorphomonas sp. SM30]GLS77285.1 diacylglycerol kinase [Oharaeibacter diazotrophicus]
MLKKLLATAAVLAVAGGAGFWVLTMPRTVAAGDLPQHVADLANGERMFNAGGCAGCHAAPGAKGEERLKLGGGLVLATPFGKFHVPNISPDEATGIGGWSTAAFVGAMKNGVDDEGEHLYPAFPYASYTHMRTEDLIDLDGYLRSLPKVANAVPDHELGFPFNVRRGLGLWKLLYLDPAPVVALPADASDAVKRGQYLVEGPGHCGECHTSRSPAGGLDRSKWLAGAPNPEGKGVIPNITGGEGGIADWSEDDIVNALSTGFKPDYDSFGGSMVEVQENISKLPPEDIAAIAAYLKAVPKLPAAAKKDES